MRNNILLIDDNVELCNGLAEILRDEGYRVDSTSESTLGSLFISQNKYDVCILDYKMKGLNLLKMIKTENPRCIVFIISGRTSIEALLKEEKVFAQVAAVFTKPFNVEGLLQKIRASIRGS